MTDPGSDRPVRATKQIGVLVHLPWLDRLLPLWILLAMASGLLLMMYPVLVSLVSVSLALRTRFPATTAGQRLNEDEARRPRLKRAPLEKADEVA
jgi:ACR3 family arsenite efflux pump ArsB